MQWYLGPEPLQDSLNNHLMPMLIEDLIKDSWQVKTNLQKNVRSQ